MKRYPPLCCLIVWLLAACQAQPATVLPTAAGSAATATQAAAVSQAAAAFDAQVAATATALHLTAQAPSATTTAPTAASPSPAASLTAAPTTAAATSLPATAPATPSPCTPPANWPAYTVKAGDTLSQVAAQTGASLAALQQANCLSSATILAGQVLRVPILPAAPSTAAPTQLPPTPLPSATPGVGASSLTVNPANPQPGEPLALTWAITESSRLAGGHFCLSLASLGGDFSYSAKKNWCDLPATGSLTVSIPTVNRDHLRFYLAGGDTQVDVRLPCPDQYFFSVPSAGRGWEKMLVEDACPASPPVSHRAVEQDFEGGRMLALDTRVYVFQTSTNGYSGHVELYDASATYTTTTDPLEVPAGKYPPDAATFENIWRGAHVWFVGQVVGETLGWAVAPAQSFQTVSQRPWETQYTVSGDTGALANASQPYNDFQYLRLSDGKVVFTSFYIGHGMEPYWVSVNP